MVHASWDEPAMEIVRDAGPLKGEALERFSVKGTSDYEAISRLINGPEAELLHGIKVIGGGSARKEVRVRWWQGQAADNAREAVYPSDPSMEAFPILHPQIQGYSAEAPPVYFGHYAAPISESIVAPNAACLDFGIGKGGHLGAYRWDGESRLSPEKLDWQQEASIA